jgi:hypothetical protein
MAVPSARPRWIDELHKSEEVNQLVYALSLAERFYFASVVCDGPRVADALLDTLRDRVSQERGAPVRLVRLDPHKGYEDQPIPFERMVEQVLAQLVAPDPEEQSSDVVFVIDASRALQRDDAWGTLFQRMNERRNTIVKKLAGPLLLCVPPRLEQVFARMAPDFWSICSLAVVVKEKPPVDATEGAREDPEKQLAQERAVLGEARERRAFHHLSTEDFEAIYGTAVQLGLASARSALIAGVAPSFVAALPHGKNPTEQLALDLHAMNRVERLADGTVPLRVWLSNAAQLSSARPESMVFQHARARLAHEAAVKPPSLASSAPLLSWDKKLSGAEIRDLTGALVDAFPTRASLAQMLRFELDTNLDEIAAAGNIRDAAFSLVTTAEAQGFIPQLFAAALAQAPRNAALLAIARRHS